MHANAVAALLQRCKAPTTGRGRARRAYAALVVLIGAGALCGGLGGRALGVAAAFWQVYGPLCDRDATTGQAGAGSLWTRGALGETAAAAALAALTLPVWTLGVQVWLGPLPGGRLGGQPLGTAGTLAWALMVQTLQGAAAEEWFWRGYVQPELGGDARAIAETAAAFALAHMVFSQSLLGAGTFVPALLFGALAHRRGRLLGATLLHAAYNVASAQWLGVR